jgi:hypothetical protein
VTVIATGFERAGATARLDRRARSRTEAKAAQAGTPLPPEIAVEDFQPAAFDVNNLDIPAFLRRR